MRHQIELRLTIAAPTLLAALRCIAGPLGRIEEVEEVRLINPSELGVPTTPEEREPSQLDRPTDDGAERASGEQEGRSDG